MGDEDSYRPSGMVILCMCHLDNDEPSTDMSWGYSDYKSSMATQIVL